MFPCHNDFEFEHGLVNLCTTTDYYLTLQHKFTYTFILTYMCVCELDICVHICREGSWEIEGEKGKKQV